MNAQILKKGFSYLSEVDESIQQELRYFSSNNFIGKKIDGYKTQAKQDEFNDKLVQGVKFIKEHVPAIVAVYDLYLKIIQAKVIIVKKLAQISQIPTFKETENGYEVTGEEGFVAVDSFDSGKGLKLVNRMEFSRINFTAEKEWDQ